MNAFSQPMMAGGVLGGGIQLRTVGLPITTTLSKGPTSNVSEITMKKEADNQRSIWQTSLLNLLAISKAALSLVADPSEFIAVQL